MKNNSTKPEYRKAEVIANWIMKFSEGEKGQKKKDEAERLCVLNGMEPGELQSILDGDFVNYDYSQLLEINKILNGKRRK